MIYKIGLALLVVYASTTTALPPCTCTRNLSPVCGSDGTTYANQCLLDCENTKGKSLTVTKHGQCDEDLIAEPVCICTYEYKPVCGTNGKTYSNECALDCDKHKDAGLTVARHTSCEAVVVVDQLPACTCTRNLQPVCGSDGNTYDNPCLLECENSKGKSITIAKEGMCEDPSTNEPCGICTLEYRPVCGSDGKTYPNTCAFECEQSKTPGLVISRQAACEAVSVVEGPDCVCGYNYLPVCGSDDQDYSNRCLLNCEQKKNPSLTLKHEGRCSGLDELLVVTPPNPTCVCTREMKFACGTNGITYNNKCLLRCAQTVDKSLQLAHEGPCSLNEPE